MSPYTVVIGHRVNFERHLDLFVESYFDQYDILVVDLEEKYISWKDFDYKSLKFPKNKYIFFKNIHLLNIETQSDGDELLSSPHMERDKYIKKFIDHFRDNNIPIILNFYMNTTIGQGPSRIGPSQVGYSSDLMIAIESIDHGEIIKNRYGKCGESFDPKTIITAYNREIIIEEILKED